MKKVIYILIGIVIIVIFYFFGPLIVKNVPALLSGKPIVVKLFACSDNCPGPQNQYMVWVYKGVTNREKCDDIGGKFSSVTGWGTFYFCEVK